MIQFTRAVLVALLAILLLCAVLTSFLEGQALGDAFYFTLITAMTVGYGDIVPTTPLGRLISVVVALVGVIYVGLVVAIANRALALAVEEKRAEQGEKPSDRES